MNDIDEKEEANMTAQTNKDTSRTLTESFSHVALVVDDEPTVRRYYQNTLRVLEWDCIAVADGRSALELLGEKRFDIVFLDLAMPGMNGAETLQEIATSWPQTFVVISTGHPESEMMRQALQIGPFGVMRKPFTLEHLRVMLPMALDFSHRVSRK